MEKAASRMKGSLPGKKNDFVRVRKSFILIF
jgi:hypothetical protein